MEIRNIQARWVLDSRGVPTVEAEVCTQDGVCGSAIVPSGASTGEHEAVELRDGEAAFHGKGVSRAINHVNDIIATDLIGLEVTAQDEIDNRLQQLDGTENKSQLGANALLAVSLAVAHAAARSRKQPLYQYIHGLYDQDDVSPSLPVPMVNIFNGGVHAEGSTAIQEFMIVPQQPDYAAGLQACSEIFTALGKSLRKDGRPTTVGDEGGYAPGISQDETALDIVTEAIQAAGYEPGKDIKLALDVAASEFHQDGYYQLRSGTKLTATEMISWFDELVATYPLLAIEDGLDENDWEGWQQLTKQLGDKVMLVGDDLLVTNPQRLETAITNRAANAILIKPNQIGTLSETLYTIARAQSAGWQCVISHRSGETEDTTIAHIAVAVAASFIKTGSVSRGERTAKYNELLRIGAQLQG